MITATAVGNWTRGQVPVNAESFDFLGRVERRYDLPQGYFRAKLPNPHQATCGFDLTGASPTEKLWLPWHLPDDFNSRTAQERQEIVAWVKRVVISGGTDYSRYQAEMTRVHYCVRFPTLVQQGRKRYFSPFATRPIAHDGLVDAPPRLVAEFADLLAFKTAVLTPIGLRREDGWNAETAAQRIHHYGLMFGALTAAPDGPVRGAGVPLVDLSFAMLVLPHVWQWYMQWRLRRRGFYTASERGMLRAIASLVREETGWLRQHPELAAHLAPVPGLVTPEAISAARADWEGACARMHAYAKTQMSDLERVIRVHRDPFEAILPILEAESPLSEYLKIADEIVRHRPDPDLYPREAAEMARAYLMIRLGLHLGLRQKNLRELLLCPRGQTPRSARSLISLQRGELRWREKEARWEVYVPREAFKNAQSSFFAGAPFRMLLPDVGGLYGCIEDYVIRHRSRILDGVADPGTLFVKKPRTKDGDPTYDRTSFYDAWRYIIRRYGIYNPYTKRGAIAGLLPHGPHCVRDVLATHILKQTGSFEQASYAIQDTPAMAARHYIRFLPETKTAIAAQVLNQVWARAVEEG